MSQTINLLKQINLINKLNTFRKDLRIRKMKNGNDVYCHICNSSFKIFAPTGIPKRLNAKCHTCFALERHRLLYLFITQKFNVFKTTKPLRLLHFAPEKFFYDIFSTDTKIEYTPCDLFPEIYDFKGQTEIVKVDITNIPFKENYFDFILCNHVLEHIPDDKQAMSELCRVMDINGDGIFQVPIDYNLTNTYEDWSITSPEEREKAFGQTDHVRWYGQDYKTRLAEVGFKVNEDNFVANYTPEEIYKYGLMSTELIYHCKK